MDDEEEEEAGDTMLTAVAPSIPSPSSALGSRLRLPWATGWKRKGCRIAANAGCCARSWVFASEASLNADNGRLRGLDSKLLFFVVFHEAPDAPPPPLPGWKPDADTALYSAPGEVALELTAVKGVVEEGAKGLAVEKEDEEEEEVEEGVNEGAANWKAEVGGRGGEKVNFSSTLLDTASFARVACWSGECACEGMEETGEWEWVREAEGTSDFSNSAAGAATAACSSA